MIVPLVDVVKAEQTIKSMSEVITNLSRLLVMYKEALKRFAPDSNVLYDDTWGHGINCTCDRCEDKAIMEQLEEEENKLCGIALSPS